MAQNNKKRMALAAALLALLIAVCAAVFMLRGGDAPVEQGNLLENGDFSDVDGGMPEKWQTGMWVTSVGASYLEAVTMEDGTPAVLVENVAANDARFEQTVAVRENATYRLTARVRAEDCDPAQMGANVSFLGIFGASEDVHDTNGEWKELTLYAKTGKGVREATVCARLGGYGSEAAGKAWFTDVSLEQVEEAPVGVTVLDLSTPKPQKAEPEAEEKGTAGVIPLLFGAAGVYLLAAFVLVRLLLTGRSMGASSAHAKFGVVLAVSLLVRLALAALVEGYGVDMGCFSAWAGKMAAGGAADFYEEGYFCDYPPAYMLVLGAIGHIANLFGISVYGDAGHLLLKMVPVVCDLLLSVVCYAAVCAVSGAAAALCMASLVLLNPAFIIAGSCWGQIDALLTLLLVVILLTGRAGKWQAAIPVFALAVLTKPQTGLLAPLGIAALIRDVRTNREARKPARIGLLLGVLVTAAIVVPFSPNQPSPLWIVDKYIETLTSYAYATLSTGNLMFLLGGNWTPLAQEMVFGMSYGTVGTITMTLGFVVGIAVYLRGKGRKHLLLAGAVTLQMIFVFGSKMHERYILPALVLLLLAYVETGDVRLLVSSVLSSAASAVNVGVVLAFEHLVAPNLYIGYILGVVQLIAAGLTIWAAAGLSVGMEPMRLLPAQGRAQRSVPGASGGEDLRSAARAEREARMREEILHGQDYRMHMTRRDWVIMLAVTAVYAAIGFWQLGASSAPQTGYTSTKEGESVVIDLGSIHEDFRIYYYGGISDTAFTVAVSDDAAAYSEEFAAKYLIGDCFKWQAVRPARLDDEGTVVDVGSDMLIFSGRYIRLTFEDAASALWEVSAVDAQGNVIPAVSAQSFGAVERRQSDPMTLIDEQDTTPEVPGWYNGMYFDEIYHARTGYEHANGLYTYETTHPPLGKVFMGICIDLMGMTPFAWRFAGALVGVLMVPAMYLLAKQLLGGTLFAAVCALLLSADCMHYTQTRIATIDSFPVLFMMLMFLFMARYMKMSFYHQRLRDTFVPLALSGVFMGLAIASKWIGCYGAIGLAVLFFMRFYQLWRQCVYAQAHRKEDPAFVRAADTFRKKGAQTIAACFLFFVFVPVVIYILSYIPYLRAYGEIKWNALTFSRLWDAQVLMFDYHANLVAEHYFASPWYEWPLIVKPMWYYQADFRPAGMASSILAFGNPAVWWTGLAGILYVLLSCVRRSVLPALSLAPGRSDENDRVLPVISICFLSAYLPWVLVSRLTFIYHYFASVPWIILATALGLKVLFERNRKAAYAVAAVLCTAAVVLFAAFFPLASGMEVPRAWCDAVNWFDGWMWY